MTGYQILVAMNHIDSRYLDAVQKKLGYLPPAERPVVRSSHRRHTLRRALSLAAAVMLMTTVLFMTAFAVSEDFREFVFRFFSVEQTNVVPEYIPETELVETDMFVEPEGFNTGGEIEGRYIHAPVSTHARGGIYLVCTDAVEMRQGSRYDAYYEENGEFFRLDEHTFNREYTLYGNTIHVEFDWVEYGGQVHFTWIDPEVQFRKSNESGGASSALFTFWLSWQDGETAYPVLLNLHTGELTDILAGTGANRMQGIAKAAINAAHTSLLLEQETDGGYFLHYVDLESGQIYSLDELSGQRTDACSLTEDALICWSLQNGYYQAWRFRLPGMERTELFDGVFNAGATPEDDAGIVFMEGFDDLNRWGDMYIGSRFALEVDEARNVWVIDLRTGVKTWIEGFQWHQNVQRTPSPDGTKLLLAGKEKDGMDFTYVGVLDFENRRHVEFSRNNENGGNEYLAYWFTKDSVVITGEERKAFEALQKQYPDLLLFPTVHASMRFLARKEPSGYLAIGQKAAHFMNTNHFVNVVEGGGMLGYQAILRTLELMREAFLEEKDTRNLIQIKGMGCGGCI